MPNIRDLRSAMLTTRALAAQAQLVALNSPDDAAAVELALHATQIAAAAASALRAAACDLRAERRAERKTGRRARVYAAIRDALAEGPARTRRELTARIQLPVRAVLSTLAETIRLGDVLEVHGVGLVLAGHEVRADARAA